MNIFNYSDPLGTENLLLMTQTQRFKTELYSWWAFIHKTKDKETVTRLEILPPQAELTSLYFSPVFTASISCNIFKRLLLKLLRKNIFWTYFLYFDGWAKNHYCYTARVYEDFINIRVHLKVKCHIGERRKFEVICAFIMKTSEGKQGF